MRPLAPVLSVPVNKISPPDAVPAAALEPAFKVNAAVPVFALLMFDETVISPDKVLNVTAPVAVIPVAVPTVPTVNAPAFTNPRLPSKVLLLPPPNVEILLPVLVSVNVPVPCKPRPAAVMAAVWVTAPVACKLTS